MVVFSEKPVLISCLFKWKKPQPQLLVIGIREPTQGILDVLLRASTTTLPSLSFRKYIDMCVCVCIYIYGCVSLSNTGYSTLNSTIGSLFDCLRCKPDEAAKTAKTEYMSRKGNSGYY